VVRLRLDEFAEDMQLRGESQHIVDSESEDEGGHELQDAPSITRSDFINDVANSHKYSRDHELPGLFNPLIPGMETERTTRSKGIAASNITLIESHIEDVVAHSCQQEMASTMASGT
jgi:hypothetical protein